MSFIDQLKAKGMNEEELRMVRLVMEAKDKADVERNVRFTFALEDTETKILLDAMLSAAKGLESAINSEDPSVAADALMRVVTLCAVEDKIKDAIRATLGSKQ